MRLVLPSNASFKNYPNNTLAQFTVRLPQALNFANDRYEVGLQEIQFYKSWWNVKDCYFKLTYNEIVDNVEIDDGYYGSEVEFIEAINNGIQSQCSQIVRERFEFHYNKHNQSCHFTVTSPKDDDAGQDIDFVYSPAMNDIINNQTEKYSLDLQSLEDKKVFFFKYNTSMRLHTIYNMMVYTDICESTIVGDTQSQLLRVVPIKGSHWQLQCTTYDTIQYIKINRKHIDSINIYLMTDYGEKVPFTHGRTVVTLDVRRVQPNSLQ